MSDLSLDKNKKYLLACSFGPDSMALFYMLVSQGCCFDCAIVNYHLREESNSEVAGLIEFAKKYAVKVFVYDCKEKIRGNVELKCREIRYSFFAKLYEQNGYDALLVAHHEDDKIETYLMQKQRQNCPIYYGIKKNSVIKGMNVIRPLLDYSKQELMDVCESNNVPYALDKTNNDISILRNRIRHEVVAKMNDDERAAILLEIGQKNKELKELLESIDNSKIHDVNYLKTLDDLSLKYALNSLVKCLGESKFLSKENVGEIKKAIFSKKPNVFSRVKKGVYFVKEYDRIDFTDSELALCNYSYSLNRPGVLDTPYFYLDFSKTSSDRNVSDADYPIVIRAASPSDYVFINGYKVLVRRLFIDWRMPVRLRLRWPIILNKDNKPLYIPRYQKDFVPSKNTNFYVK